MGFLDKAKGFARKHDDKIDKAVGKAGDMVDRKTGGKYHQHVDRAQGYVRGQTGKGDTTSPSTTRSTGPDSPTSTGSPAGASGSDDGLQPGTHPGDVAAQPTASQRIQPDEPATDAPVAGGGTPGDPGVRPQGPGAGEGGPAAPPSTGAPTSENGDETLGGVQTSDTGEADSGEPRP